MKRKLLPPSHGTLQHSGVQPSGGKKLKSHEAQRLANRHGHFAAVAGHKSNEQRCLSDRDLQRVLWKGKHQGLPKFNVMAVANRRIFWWPDIFPHTGIYSFPCISDCGCPVYHLPSAQFETAKLDIT